MQKLQGLYVIADAKCIGKSNIISKTKEVLSAGARIIQYRDKENSVSDQIEIAKQLRTLTKSFSSLFIINDDVELAINTDADGVHLGKEDTSIKSARKLLGRDKIIGASCYANVENAKPAIQATADYIAFGSFFASPIKPDAPKANLALIQQAKQEFNIPICAIGGITPHNATDVIHAGADMIAVISAIFSTSSPQHAVQEYLSLF